MIFVDNAAALTKQAGIPPAIPLVWIVMDDPTILSMIILSASTMYVDNAVAPIRKAEMLPATLLA